MYKAIAKKDDTGLIERGDGFELIESGEDDADISNILIKGDNLLALNTLKKIFDKKPDEEKVKCIYIDPPYNTGSAFEHYDDNLIQSQWLSLMRDRLTILSGLLSNSGSIFVQISDKNEGHLRLLLDEVFGKDNFVNKITVKTKSPSGFQSVNAGVFETAEYILFYSKNKTELEFTTLYIESKYDQNYKFIIENYQEPFAQWHIASLTEYFAKELGYTNFKEAQRDLGKETFAKKVADFAIDNAERVFRFTEIDDNGASKETVELKNKSKLQLGKVFRQERENYSDRFIYEGKEIAFYSKKIKTIDSKRVPTVQLTNIWTDIPYEGISREGSVIFQQSKKPEKLIQRILELTTVEKDLVLDCFGGSGTTFAVAHKMNRRWIGVEIGDHADTHIVKRLKSVISGEDQSGISKTVEWKGGGGFKYYHLGESIIKYDESGRGDFNWSLGEIFIQESLLQSYDYLLDEKISIGAGGIEIHEKNYSVGYKNVGNSRDSLIITLCSPAEGNDTISLEEIKHIYNTVKKAHNSQNVTIFTNRGVEIAYEDKPEDLEIVKIPHAIFAELER